MAILKTDLTQEEAEDLLEDDIVPKFHGTGKTAAKYPARSSGRRTLNLYFRLMISRLRTQWKRLTDGQRDEWKEQARWDRVNRGQDIVHPWPPRYLPTTSRISGFALFCQKAGAVEYYVIPGLAYTTGDWADEWPYDFSLTADTYRQSLNFYFKYGSDWAHSDDVHVHFFQVDPLHVRCAKPRYNARHVAYRAAFAWEPLPEHPEYMDGGYIADAYYPFKQGDRLAGLMHSCDGTRHGIHSLVSCIADP